MAKFIVSMMSPLVREYEIVADDMEAAIEIAATEFIRDFPTEANTTAVEASDVSLVEAWEIDNNGDIVDGFED
jgi:hypothetical protein